MIGKLIGKVISERLQFQLISKDFIYLCQLGSLKQCSIIDVGVALIYFIHIGWIKNASTSTFVFDIAQFFPLLNHQILSLILDKTRFDSKILFFFCNYLVSRKTTYLWNNSFSPLFNVDIEASQVSALSPILFILYLFLILHIFEKQYKNLKIPISILSFVNNELFVT